MKLRALAVAAGLLVALFARGARADDALRVLVPDADNLQYMSFWLAKGAGYFAEEHLTVALVIPEYPQETLARFARADEVDCAVLPPPVYVQLMAAGAPVVLVANLLENDPIDLVIKKSVAQERKLTADMPLRDRLLGLRGLRLGVAPHPPTRLRALFTSQGLDADQVLEVVILRGKEQNAAFREGKVDALYAHTPFLEQAIVKDDAYVLVNQSKGEVPVLAHRQIHTLACRREFLQREPEKVEAAVRAIARAEELVHRASQDAVAALARAFPDRDRRELETIVSLYEPAIPKAPEVSADRIAASVTFFPYGTPAPDLSRVDLNAYVAPEIARHVDEERSVRTFRGIWLFLGALTFLSIAISLLFRARGRRPG